MPAGQIARGRHVHARTARPVWPMRPPRLALVLAMQVAVRIAAVGQEPDEIQQQLGNIDTHGLSPQF